MDNEALRQALLEGRIAGAGLDTLSPEPVPAGHPLTALPPEVQRKVVLAPHLAALQRHPSVGPMPTCGEMWSIWLRESGRTTSSTACDARRR